MRGHLPLFYAVTSRVSFCVSLQWIKLSAEVKSWRAREALFPSCIIIRFRCCQIQSSSWAPNILSHLFLLSCLWTWCFYKLQRVLSLCDDAMMVPRLMKRLHHWLTGYKDSSPKKFTLSPEGQVVTKWTWEDKIGGEKKQVYLHLQRIDV